VQLKVNETEARMVATAPVGTEKEPALLFVHGAGGGAFVWDAQEAHFRGRHRLYRLELPGHGGAPGEALDRIRDQTEVVRAGLGAAGERAVLPVGHSMGGAVVLELAADPAPEVWGAVVVGSGARLRVTPTIFDMIGHRPDDFFKWMEQEGFCAETALEIRQRVMEGMRRSSPAVLLRDFQACDRFDMRGRLDRIRLPLLIVCGEEDRLTPLSYSEFLQEQIDGSRLVVIPRAGHMVMAERPQPFNAALERFIAQLKPGG
jgi:pimeloyl-ACP methyl ester carboxylesterase